MPLKEIKGNLFDDKESALAHCVAADFKMGAGIAVQFKKLYGHATYLQSLKNVKVGNTIICTYKDREIAYMVTKTVSSRCYPTYASLHDTLVNLFLNVKNKNIAMPRIACGLDKLEWDKVKLMIEELCPSDTNVIVYSL